MQACLKQSQEDSTCQDGEKWKSGSNNETEVLIQGYQKENERLVEKLKELKMQHENEKLSLYEERRQLGCQLNLLRNQVMIPIFRRVYSHSRFVPKKVAAF